MAAITLAQADAQLAAWLDASTKVAQGQSYSIGTRSLTRADAKEIREQITFWEGKVNQLTSGASGIRTRGLSLG